MPVGNRVDKALRRTAGLSAIIFPFYALWYWKQFLLLAMTLIGTSFSFFMGSYDARLREGMSSVALDDTSCIALTIHQQGPNFSSPRDSERRYNEAVREGRILSLQAGFKVKEVQALMANHWTMLRPEPDSKQRKQLFEEEEDMLLVTLEEGTLKGKQVCVPSVAVVPRFGPWP